MGTSQRRQSAGIVGHHGAAASLFDACKHNSKCICNASRGHAVSSANENHGWCGTPDRPTALQSQLQVHNCIVTPLGNCPDYFKWLQCTRALAGVPMRQWCFKTVKPRNTLQAVLTMKRTTERLRQHTTISGLGTYSTCTAPNVIQPAVQNFC
jgi:hypothetical protein